MEKSQIKSKIDLEVLIFKLANEQNISVLACKGILIVPHASNSLALLVNIYNKLFAKENQRFLKEELIYIQAFEAKSYQLYLQFARRHLLPLSFYLHIY